jgi:hypothetical protein
MAADVATHAADGKLTLPIGLSFQLYKSLLPTPSVTVVRCLPSKPSQLRSLDLAVEVHYSTHPVWARVHRRAVEIVKDRQNATFGLLTIQCGLSIKLALIALVEEILLNGTRALGFSVLDTKDSIFLSQVGVLLYLTERFQPYVGSPDEESGLLGLECPCCSIEIQSEPRTHVVTCRCGAVYHHETKETHPDLDPKERLNCLNKIKHCLRCKQELSTQETLVWDPSTF